MARCGMMCLDVHYLRLEAFCLDLRFPFKNLEVVLDYLLTSMIAMVIYSMTALTLPHI